ncbi:MULTISPECIES: hypothetical protein [Brevibacillus]|uniref:hypothetical protein n=1 Tax=Brevibacillus TaxID=55080 RepID=UPI000D0E906D|nr:MULTISPECIES: hypothetical protein [Brevibacillus]PSJ67643.1 hypothetical protein C7J99_18960 [Brevibacillus brevis]RED28196.1 hypothetical protein DES34_10857 [Brevibacillus brevis]TQK74153.1 hypothetical protein FB479_102794 [Brevibacillus sp. AG162]VEF90892.1 Uncharacterised protein [Brevibacillus brevis]GEC90482.1 hypothetical protein BBR01nite_28130 [Brevibacillus brevis]
MIDVTYLKRLFLNRGEDLDIRLAEIGDLLEYGTHDPNDVITFTEHALDLAIAEENFDVKERLFYLLMNAVTYQGVARNVEWDPLADVLPTLDDAILDYALSILGCSKNRKFIKVMEPYLHSPNDSIRETAAEALEDINYNVEGSP